VKVGDLVRLNDKNRFGINYSNDGICVLGIVTKKSYRGDHFQVHWFDRELARIFYHGDYFAFDSNDFEVINESR